MKNKDVLMQEKTKILQQMNEAIAKNDPDAFAEAFEKLSMNIQENILSEVEAQQQAADTVVLAGRPSADQRGDKVLPGGYPGHEILQSQTGADRSGSNNA